jgi:phage head-tail adaptor, putative, SPP1 family
MLAGSLRHRIRIERKQESRNDFGETTWAWVPFTPWIPASIEPLQGREFFAAQQVQGALSARIRIRYVPGVRTSMRAVHEIEVGAGSPSVARYYNIEAVLNLNERNREIHLMCSQREADGFRAEKAATTEEVETTPADAILTEAGEPLLTEAGEPLLVE